MLRKISINYWESKMPNFWDINTEHPQNKLNQGMSSIWIELKYN